MSSEKDGSQPVRRRLACTPYFDALWFCYSPVHQMQQYYRVGNVDNCGRQWSDLIDCLKLKTKRASEVEKVLEEREQEQARKYIWTMRTYEEASVYWKKLYGHLEDPKQ